MKKLAIEQKINIKYIKAIESGDFADIESPYLRLFLRAYADEIGGDSVRALEQLDSFMGATSTPLSSKFNIKNELKEDYDLQNEILLIQIFQIRT